MTEVELLSRKLQREISARRQAESILEQKTRELFLANEATQKSNLELAVANNRLQQDIADRLRGEQALIAKELEARLLHRAASMASENHSSEVALAKCLELVGSASQWTVGHAYITGNGQTLMPTGIWYEREPGRHARFRSVSEKMSFERGVGLPGRVLASGEPAWIVDVQHDQNFPRGAACRETGLRGAFAFPIKVAGTCAVILEFFRENVAAEDLQFLQIIRSVSEQLGRVLERKHAEKALRASEQRIRLIIDSALDAVVSIDARGIVHDWNAQAQLMFGKSHEQAIGRPISELILLADAHGSAPRQLLSLISDSGAQLLNRRTELRALGQNGKEFPIEIAVAPVPLGDDTGYSIFLRDVSDRHRAAAEREQLTSQLIAVSRSAGMAEVATGVLHNVGNVLNSVNVSVTLLADMVGKSRLSKLTRAVAMIQQHVGDLADFLTRDPKGRQLPDYLAKLSAHLFREHEDVLAELSSLERNVEHIKQIVSMQQSHARSAKVTESLSPQAVLDDAVGLNRTALERHQIKVIRNYEPLTAIQTDKHKVLQILVNLISNAKHSMRDTLADNRQLTLRVGSGADGSGVMFQVIDSGIGIAPENLTRIFSHGFTTREEGHGFGLHTAALAAKELGGALSVQSEGPGHGATFSLQLPLAPPPTGTRHDLSQIRALQAPAKEMTCTTS